jgi:hypothetical protein
MARTISSSDDVIDSRDIIARKDELESEREDLVSALDEAREALSELQADEPPNSVQEDGEDGEEFAAYEEKLSEAKQALLDASNALDEWDEDNGEELKGLVELCDEAPGDDWEHGATLINESYFTDYCQELVSDIGDLPKDIPGYLVIDWEATANNLRADYTSVEWEGTTFYVR